LVLLQGIAEAVRCVLCLKHGKWPQRLHEVEKDVEETEVAILQQREHEIERQLRLDREREGGAK
jgi:hypothetical protein